MMENFELVSSLCCCCGAENVEEQTEQNISVRVSQARNPTLALSSQKSHTLCETCGLVLGNIFHVMEGHPQQIHVLLRCGACAKQFYFSTKFHQQHLRESMLIGDMARMSLSMFTRIILPVGRQAHLPGQDISILGLLRLRTGQMIFVRFGWHFKGEKDFTPERN